MSAILDRVVSWEAGALLGALLLTLFARAMGRAFSRWLERNSIDEEWRRMQAHGITSKRLDEHHGERLKTALCPSCAQRIPVTVPGGNCPKCDLFLLSPGNRKGVGH